MKLYFLLILFLSLLLACKNYMVVVDDSSTDIISFKIDQSKRKAAFELIESYELKLAEGNLEENSILKDVSMIEVFEDLRAMLNYPNSTQLGNTGHYCSVAVVLNWLLNNQPQKYTKAVLELTSTGWTTFSDKKKLIVPNIIRKNIDYTVIDTSNYRLVRADIESTSISDFVFGVSLVYSEKWFQKIGLLHPKATYKKSSIGNFIFSNTAPWEIDNLFRKVGVTMHKQGYYLGDKETADEIFMIEEAVKSGKMPVIFDNHWLSFAQGRNFLYEFTGAHFITIHFLEVDKEKGIVNYCFWDYGRVKNNPYLTRTIKPKLANTITRTIKKSKRFKKRNVIQKHHITIKEFLKAMKGYWIPVN